MNRLFHIARPHIGDFHLPSIHRHRREIEVERAALGAGAVGALALGAFAVGALAIGALAINRLAINRARVKRLSIGTLEVDRLIVREQTEAELDAGTDGEA
jgi:hypothetical protein